MYDPYEKKASTIWQVCDFTTYMKFFGKMNTLMKFKCISFQTESSRLLENVANITKTNYWLLVMAKENTQL